MKKLALVSILSLSFSFVSANNIIDDVSSSILNDTTNVVTRTITQIYSTLVNTIGELTVTLATSGSK